MSLEDKIRKALVCEDIEHITSSDFNACFECQVKKVVAVFNEERSTGPLRRVVKCWDDRTARYTYQLRYWQENAIFGSIPLWVTVAEGDRGWAARHAEHYGIEIEEDSK